MSRRPRESAAYAAFEDRREDFATPETLFWEGDLRGESGGVAAFEAMGGTVAFARFRRTLRESAASTSASISETDGFTA